MSICLRLTSIATLLVGLQLLNPDLLPTKAALNLLNNNSSNHVVIASNSNNSGEYTFSEQSRLDDFIPPDNGHPNNTRGSGTR
jgi:hypothetical protein